MGPSWPPTSCPRWTPPRSTRPRWTGTRCARRTWRGDAVGARGAARRGRRRGRGRGPAGLDGGLGPGEAVRIMTGAPVPPGADAVVPVERTSTGRFTPGAAGSGPTTVAVHDASRTHVRTRGEDVRRGTSSSRQAPCSRRGTSRSRRPPGTRPCACTARRASRCSPPAASSWRRGPRRDRGTSGLQLRPARRGGPHGGRARGPARGRGRLRGGARRDAGRAARRVRRRPARPARQHRRGERGAFDVVREVLDPATRAGTPWQDAVTDARLVAVGMRPGRPQGLGRWRVCRGSRCRATP